MLFRSELFVHNDSNQPLRVTGPIRMDERVPKELVDEGTWAWRDPSWEDGFELAPQSLRVLRWNGAKDSWGVNTEHRIDWRIGPVASEPSNTPTNSIPFALRGPDLWIESIVFHSPKQAPHASYPAQVSITIRNQKSKRLQLKSCRMWLPKDNDSFTLLFPRFTFDDIKTWSGDREIAANDLTGFTLEEPSLLPRTYTAIEVELIEEDSSESIRVWGYLKIRPAEFDISGGWISNSVKSKPSMANEDYLKTLSLLRVNTGQIEEAPGYSDNKEFSSKYLFKKFNRLGNRERYDSDEMLPSIHAVEFLGEPQYGGGRPVPPQEEIGRAHV